MNYKFDKDAILEATNGGLDIILRLYPEAEKNQGKFQHFKTHNESTPSSIVFKNKKGKHLIKNFGGGENMTPFDAVMDKMGVDFADACKWIATEFNLEGPSSNFGQAEIRMEPAIAGQVAGSYYFKYRSRLTDLELQVLGPTITQETARQFDLKSCEYFIQVKQYEGHKQYGDKLMQIITKSTDTYPILVFDKKDWQKIYQPLNKDKGYRFRYAGNKPSHYLFGQDLIEDQFKPLPKDFNENDKDKYKEKYGENGEDDPRANVIIIAGGDRDALNIASLDYPVVWKNSETEPLSREQYKFLDARCKKLCYIGDLDATGVEETIKIALRYLDLKIIWLPEWLKNRSYRGKPQKDMTDYCKALYNNENPEYLKNQFALLVKDALPSRFWDYKYLNNGIFKGFDVNNEALYRFLQYNGYYRIKEENSKEPFSYIRIGKGIIKRVDVDEIQNFPANFVKERKKGYIDLLNYIHRSPQLSDKKLSKLDIVKPDLSGTHGPKKQCFFFKNKIWEITPDAITAHNYGTYDVTVWENKIIDREVHLKTDPIFKIEKIDGVWDIQILKKDNHFLNFLINTSRSKWRVSGDKPFKDEIKKISSADPSYKEKVAAIWRKRDQYREANKFNIAEAGLDQEDIAEQKLNLVNKIFAFGFALHRHKVDSKAWSCFAMDGRISEISDSNGGSGKSIVWHKALVQILQNYKYINGGDPDSAKDKFLYDGVTPDTDAVIFDDLDSHFPMKKVYNNVTGEFNINAKFGKPYSLKYKDSPKVFFTSNFGIYGNDSSTMRRLLITEFSDYYHHSSDQDLNSWSVRDDLGFDLFTGFDDDQWNDFYAFCAQACQFQMATDEKIDPHMGNINKRNALQTIGDAFADLADSFFDTRKNILVVKEHAYKAFLANGFKGSSQLFKKRLYGWCKLHGYEMNPELTLNTEGRCKFTINGKSQECVYIKTPDVDEINLSAPAPENIPDNSRLTPKQLADLSEDKDDIPY